MRKLTREPSSGTYAASAAAELQRAKSHFEGTGRLDGFDFNAYRDPEVKRALSKMSGGNCAYCEADYDATQPVDVEHFRPKKAIDTEGGWIQPGYWWLAADWDNLLPSCIRCNRPENIFLFDGSELVKGKGNRFPLNDEGRRAHAIGEEADETPLLIHPCREDPADFIRFEDRGGMWIAVPLEDDSTSLSARRARASIEVYGLNRAGLVEERSRYVARARLSLAQLTRAARRLDRLNPDDDESRRDTELDIAEHLDSLSILTSGQDPFTGVLRTVIGPTLAMLTISLSRTSPSETNGG